MVGYFCDFIHVYCNYSESRELSGDVAETTQLFSQIKACEDPQFAQLIEIVESSPLYKLATEAAGCKFAVAAPLFLFLKARYINGIKHKPDAEFIDYAKKVGGFECSIAIYLLGLSLSYDKTYDAFYDYVSLPLFKKSPEKVIPDDGSGLPTDEKLQQPESDTKNIQGELFPGNGSSEHQGQLPICWMRKDKDIRPVFNEDEESKLANAKYSHVKKYNIMTVKEAMERLGYKPEQEINRLRASKQKK